MNNTSEDQYIRCCLDQAAARLNRGPASGWTSYDFEKLSEAIRDVTGVTLSVTTLKRLWGKVKYDNLPAITTLNTLARYCGKEDWQHFKQTVVAASTTAATTASATPLPTHQSEQKATPANTLRQKWYWAAAILPIAALVWLVLLATNRSQKGSANPADYQFSSKTILTKGVPNSVVFQYDATAAGNDTVYISQTWDTRRKVAVPRQDTTYSSIYYMPGYFKAKLMVGDQIMREHDLMIATDGWLAVMEQPTQEAPFYFKKEIAGQPGGIAIEADQLAAHQIPLLPAPPGLRFFNVQDFGHLPDDDFVFETTVRSAYNDAAACQNVEVLILCKDDVFIIPLCAKGCVGNLYLRAASAQVTSGKADLSGFGCDLNEWVNLRVESKKGKVQFLVNGTTAYILPFTGRVTDIVGVQYRFRGTGAVKDTRFQQGSRLIRL